MEASYYIGIDISKQRLDWRLIDAWNTELATGQVADLREINDQMQLQNDQFTILLKQVDRTINELLQQYNTTKGQYDLLVSIPGIGPIIAGWLLVSILSVSIVHFKTN
jgi:hypothetical protein